MTVMVLGINQLLPLWLCALLNTVLAYLLFTPMHEASHYNVSGNQKGFRFIDELAGFFSGLTLFAPHRLFRVMHFEHHAHTNDEHNDPDHYLASSSLPALCWHSLTILPNYLVQSIKYLRKKQGSTLQGRRDIRFGLMQFALQIVLLIVLTQMFGWALPVLLWLLPAIGAQALLAFAFDWLPHHPHEERRRYLNTRTFNYPGLTVLLLSQNLHLLHHLKPRVPFYRYSEEFKKVRPKVEAAGGLIYEPSK